MTKMAKLDTLFLTKTAKIPSPFQTSYTYIPHNMGVLPGGRGVEGAARNGTQKYREKAGPEKAGRRFVRSLHQASLFFFASPFFRTAPQLND